MKKVNKLKTTQRINIFIAILGSYIVVFYTVPHIFVANSFQIKDTFIAWLRLTPQRVYSYMRYPLDNAARVNLLENASLNGSHREDKDELQYKPVSDNVYAAEDPTTKEKFIKIEKGAKVEIHYLKLSDGREVKVYVPVK